MIINPRYCLCLVFLFLLPGLYAQTTRKDITDITGSWEAYRNQEYMQFNIEQRGKELCGYSYDYELYDKGSYCIADFAGGFDSEKKIWFISGTGFIANSGTHVLMRIVFWNNSKDPANVLRGKVFLQSSSNNLFGMGGDDILVKKVSNSPVWLAGQKPCFPPKPKPEIKKPAPVTPPIARKEQPKSNATRVQPKKPQATTLPKPEIPKQARSETPKQILPKVQSPVISKKDSSQLQLRMIARKQVKQSRLVVNVNKLNLKLYDNGTVDGDSVSVFYNGRLLLSHQRLSEKPIELNIDLDQATTLHEITMYAENLGTIIPNTALVIVTAGNKRYELRSKASLEENAVLVFEYRPD